MSQSYILFILSIIAVDYFQVQHSFFFIFLKHDIDLYAGHESNKYLVTINVYSSNEIWKLSKINQEFAIGLVSWGIPGISSFGNYLTYLCSF